MKNSICFILSILFATTIFCGCSEEDDSILNEENSLSEIKYVAQDFDFSPFLNASDSFIKTKVASQQFVRAAYPSDITGIRVVPSDYQLPESGGRISITFEGTFSSYLVRILDVYKDIYIFEQYIYGDGSNGGNLTYNYGPHFSPNGVPLYLIVEYYDPNNFRWVTLAYYMQNPSEMAFKSNITTTNIPVEGGAYRITQEGNYPSAMGDIAFFRAITADGEIVQQQSTVMMGYPMNYANITILSNSSTPRIVHLQFSTVQEPNNWTTFETWLQEGDSFQKIITLKSVELWGIQPAGGQIHVYLWGDPTELNAGDQIPVRITGLNNVLGSRTTPIEDVAICGTILPAIYQDAGKGYHAAVTLSIPSLENNGWGAYYNLNLGQPYTPYMDWSLEYYDGEQWRPLGPLFGQNNYFLSVKNSTTNLSAANGGYWALEITGRFPYGLIVFRAVDQFGNPAGNGDVIVNPSTSLNLPSSVQLYVSPTGSSRKVYLEYSTNGGVSFTRWEKVNPTTYWQGSNYIQQN